MDVGDDLPVYVRDVLACGVLQDSAMFRGKLNFQALVIRIS